jgi:hypothetical protein
MPELRRRAKASGVSTEALAAVDDMIGPSVPKAEAIRELVRLIIEQEIGPEAAEAVATSGSLRRELTSMSLSALKSKARSMGVNSDALEEADDDDDPVAAVKELVMDATPISPARISMNALVAALKNPSAFISDQLIHLFTTAPAPAPDHGSDHSPETKQEPEVSEDVIEPDAEAKAAEVAVVAASAAAKTKESEVVESGS